MPADGELPEGPPPNTLSSQVLKLFQEMGQDRLDLHVLFEAAGNIPAKRQEVLEAIEDLSREGLVEPSGADFYTVTSKGKALIARE
jgi:predicted transcriptional regulator